MNDDLMERQIDLVVPSLDLRPRARGHIINLTPKGRLVAETLSALMEE